MAFTTQKGRTATSLSEINVVPLVDVMLVLLIIFMITAPMMHTGIEVNLPQTRNVRTATPEGNIVINISRLGELYNGSDAINFHDLPARIKRDARGPEEEIYIRADKDARWEVITSVMVAVRDAGFSKVNHVLQPYTPPAAKR